MAEVEKLKQKKNIFKRSFSEYIWGMHCLKTEKKSSNNRKANAHYIKFIAK